MTAEIECLERAQTETAKLPSFITDERGTATIEFVMWFPVVVFLFGLIVNVTMLFYEQNEVLRTIQDANRSLSIGRLSSVTETETYIKTRLVSQIPNVTATSTISSGVVQTVVTYPATDLLWFDFFDSLNGMTLTARASHLIEDYS